MLHAKALHLISQISASFRGFFVDFWYTNGVSMAMYAWVLLKTFPGKMKEKIGVVLLCEMASTSHTNDCVTTVLKQLCSSILPIQSI